MILLPVLWNSSTHSVCIVESALQFPQCGKFKVYHIVEHITMYFPHCGNYQCFFYKMFLTFELWQSTMLIIWNISSTFLKLSIQNLYYRFIRTSTNLPAISQISSTRSRNIPSLITASLGGGGWIGGWLGELKQKNAKLNSSWSWAWRK